MPFAIAVKRPILAAVAALIAMSAPLAGAGAAGSGGTGLPLPRYVSLKAERVNMRVGPGTEYAVSWLYLKRGLPMEVVQEYDLWRRVRDSEGTEGWVYHSLLSGDRTAEAAPWLKGKEATIDVRAQASEDSTLIAQMQPGVVSKVDTCGLGWCEIEVAGRTGYVHQHEIWGVYPDEQF
ncbi:SH3 domain-containing protein [Consotaella aegiceratis]|uniref:SH3 domain-containing protein n=1 Tax=Consotaella aegiceratis TaxID=3097961 RepID=UPI002F42043C